MDPTEIAHRNEWIYRQRVPAGPGPHPLILMLHGWTGDENSMWVFASRLPEQARLIAPRGLHTTPLGGYGWHEHKSKAWPWVDDFRPSIQALLEFLSPQNFPMADVARFSLVGFSQGAALAFTLALLFPERVRAVAGLSGFLPDGASVNLAEGTLKHKPVFLAHGTRDELVPVERARQAVKQLQQSGAQVDYCEDNVGHKLSATCFRSLEVFFQDVMAI